MPSAQGSAASHDAATTGWLAAIHAVVADMDGVLWRGDEMIGDAVAFLQQLRDDGVPFVLATNNASKPPKDYVDRLGRSGFALGEAEVLTSSVAAAESLSRRYPPETPVHALGGPGLRRALVDAGFDLVEDATRRAALVIVGIDFGLTYDKLAHATLQLHDGAAFFATNADPTYPSGRVFLPGAGSIVAAVRVASGKEPEVIGKPGRAMFDIAVGRLGALPAHTLMIGDRLDTDILGARRAGLRSALVRTGVDKHTDLEQSAVKPDLDVECLADLGRLLRSARRHANVT